MKNSSHPDDLVLVRMQDHGTAGRIAFVTINNPTKRNALGMAGKRAIAEAFLSLSLDEDLRAFLILAASFILGRRAAVREGRSDTRFGNGAFNAFFRDRAELGFLLSHIKAARA